MTSIDITINVETKNRINKITKLDLIHFKYLHYNIHYITIYHTYLLLYCKGHIQMISNDSIINVETKNSE